MLISFPKAISKWDQPVIAHKIFEAEEMNNFSSILGDNTGDSDRLIYMPEINEITKAKPEFELRFVWFHSLLHTS